MYIRKLNLTIVASIYRHLKVKNQTKMTEKGKHNPLLAGLIVLVACFFAVACAINYMSLNPGNSGGKKMDNNCNFMTLSTVFLSRRVDGMVIHVMKWCLQRNPIYGRKEFRFYSDPIPVRFISRQSLNLRDTGAPRNTCIRY